MTTLVEMDKVTFRYHKNQNPIIENLRLQSEKEKSSVFWERAVAGKAHCFG